MMNEELRFLMRDLKELLNSDDEDQALVTARFAGRLASRGDLSGLRMLTVVLETHDDFEDFYEKLITEMNQIVEMIRESDSVPNDLISRIQDYWCFYRHVKVPDKVIVAFAQMKAVVNKMTLSDENKLHLMKYRAMFTIDQNDYLPNLEEENK